MKLSYLLKRLKFRISTDGVLNIFRDLLYYNREVILCQKDLSSFEPDKIDQSLEYTIVNRENSKSIEKIFDLPIFDYYAQNNCKTLIATKGPKLIGFIRWTIDKNFKDLQKFGIQLGSDHAYMFDFFIFPEYRGGSAGKDITQFALNDLKIGGITKYFGFFFSDNFPALWWHRTICKTKELRRIKTHKFLTLEIVNGKLFS